MGLNDGIHSMCTTGLSKDTLLFSQIPSCHLLVKKIPLMHILMGNIRKRRALDLCALLAGNRHSFF